MKLSETELNRFYTLFSKSIEIAHQFKDPAILKMVKAVMPHVEGKVGVIDVTDLATWFARDFMKWSYDPALPRYNEVEKLLETRVGRCGEWAILFTTMVNAMGLPARYVLDWTDHVWTEVYLGEWPHSRWVHVDPTLGKDVYVDHPYFYEDQWKKKLSYIIAFSGYRIVDVTENYTHHWDKVRKRRKLDPIPDLLMSTWNGARHG